MRSISKMTFFAVVLVTLSCSSDVQVNQLIDSCLAKTNMGEAICTCTANLAKNELSPTGFRFIVASINKDETLASKLKGDMSIDEIMAAGMFMVNGPARCAKAGKN